MNTNLSELSSARAGLTTHWGDTAQQTPPGQVVLMP